jgi:hypothetical protein
MVGCLAACQTAYLHNTPTGNTASIGSTATLDLSPTPDEWADLSSDGVELRLKVPSGWQARSMDNGILVAQEFTPMYVGDIHHLRGLQFHLFIHPMTEFNLPVDTTNAAESILNQIVRIPDYVGGAAVSTPRGFHWDQYEAAYYLLNAGDGTLTMLLALVLQNPPRLIVCNINAPTEKAAHIRTALPLIFRDFSVNGTQLDVSALYRLPFPLEFPHFEAADREKPLND